MPLLLRNSRGIPSLRFLCFRAVVSFWKEITLLWCWSIGSWNATWKKPGTLLHFVIRTQQLLQPNVWKNSRSNRKLLESNERTLIGRLFNTRCATVACLCCCLCSSVGRSTECSERPTDFRYEFKHWATSHQIEALARVDIRVTNHFGYSHHRWGKTDTTMEETKTLHD